jgi:hypothetical protein
MTELFLTTIVVAIIVVVLVYDLALVAMLLGAY